MEPTLLLLALTLAFLVLYVLRTRRHDPAVWSPAAAWNRAAIYFCYCLLVADLTGALDALLSSPLAFSGQLDSATWWAATLGVTGFMVWAYWIYWYRNTLQFGRSLQVLPQLAYGLAWGITTGVYMLSFWHIADWLTGSYHAAVTWLIAYAMIGAWQALWMDLVWDVWVSPEHDTPQAKKDKVPRTHVPNMTLCLAHFALFGNYWIFVGWQTIALTAASFGMRMPPPWSKEPALPSRREPGLFGLPHAVGFIDETESEGSSQDRGGDSND